MFHLDFCLPLLGHVLLLLLMLDLIGVEHGPLLGLLHRNVPDPVGQGGVLGPPVEGPQLDHVVDEADDGHAAGALLLQVLDVVVEVVHVPALLVVVAVAVGQVLELGSES